eukprot:624557-Amphidinium_carterae.1
MVCDDYWRGTVVKGVTKRRNRIQGKLQQTPKVVCILQSSDFVLCVNLRFTVLEHSVRTAMKWALT